MSSKEHSRLYFALLCCVVLAQVFGPSPAGPALAGAQKSDDEDSLRKRLEKMKADIEREEAKAQSLRKSQADIQTEISRIEKQQLTTATVKNDLTKSATEIDMRMAQAAEALVLTQAEAEKTKQALGKRVAALYKSRRRRPAVDYLFQATSATDLLKRAFYVTKIAEHDKESLTRLNEQLLAVRKKQTELTLLKAEKTKRLSEIAGVEKELEDQRGKKNVLLKQQHDKMEAAEKSIGKLRTSAAAIEAMISKIMGGESEKQPPVEPDGKKPEEVKIVTALSRLPQSESPGTPFDGPGLEHMKGKLSFPAGGQVVQLFGRQKHDEFTDMLFNKGIEVEASSGSEVRAVADGKVIFSKPLPGYGKVVILDHGARYYTLYGRLGDPRVLVGDTVRSGDAVGVLGDIDKRGHNFYFELRIRGKASDPAPYFKAMPVSKQAREAT